MLKDNAVKQATRQYEDATPLLNDRDSLRQRADQDGFLFFKALLPKDYLLQVRHDILDILQQRNLLDECHSLTDGIANEHEVQRLDEQTFAGLGVPTDLYLQVQKLESFHSLAHETAMLNVFRLLYGEEPFVHPRNIARIMLAHDAIKPTPPHQDYIHIQGTPATWTSWFPLGHCSKELGGLSMLAGSHKEGVIGVTEHESGAGGLETVLCGYDFEWVEGDFELGDVLIFHSHAVHKALPNQLGARIRLSCDFRYQPCSQEIDPSSLHVHGLGDSVTWADIYENWSNEALMYYWKDLDLKKSEWNEQMRWQKDKIC